MSADNYYWIVPHPVTQGFAVMMLFASDDSNAIPEPNAQSFPTLTQAIMWTMENEYTEYGLQISPGAALRAKQMEKQTTPPVCCYYCKSFLQKGQFKTTRAGKIICPVCQIRYNMCEICGSTKSQLRYAGTQLHYKEECFK